MLSDLTEAASGRSRQPDVTKTSQGRPAGGTSQGRPADGTSQGRPASGTSQGRPAKAGAVTEGTSQAWMTRTQQGDITVMQGN